MCFDGPAVNDPELGGDGEQANFTFSRFSSACRLDETRFRMTPGSRAMRVARAGTDHT